MFGKIYKLLTVSTAVGIFCLCSAADLPAGEAEPGSLKCTVKNPVDISRKSETVSLGWKKIKNGIEGINKNSVCVYDSQTGKYLQTQVSDNDCDGKEDSLLFQTDFSPGEKKRFVIMKKPEDYTAPASESRAFCMFVPERKDDFAWENDLVAFRMYGPALEEENISSGIDVWVKSVHYPILKKWYAGHDYHTDHGEGLDFYKVGTSRGCGGIAMFKEDRLYVSRNFAEWKIIENGPVRVIFELTYQPWGPEDAKFREVKRISLDKGSFLNRIETRFKTDRAVKAVLAPGIVVEEGHNGISYDTDKGWMGYWGKADPQNGIIGCGVVLTETDDIEYKHTRGHIFLTGKHNLSQPFTYYTGACWNKGNGFKTFDEWKDYLKKFSLKLNNPLEIQF